MRVGVALGDAYRVVPTLLMRGDIDPAPVATLNAAVPLYGVPPLGDDATAGTPLNRRPVDLRGRSPPNDTALTVLPAALPLPARVLAVDETELLRLMDVLSEKFNLRPTLCDLLDL